MIYLRESDNTFGSPIWIDIYHCINCDEIFNPEIAKDKKYRKTLDPETGLTSYEILH